MLPLRNRSVIKLDGHNFDCLGGRVKADISISPVIKNGKCGLLKLQLCRILLSHDREIDGVAASPRYRQNGFKRLLMGLETR